MSTADKLLGALSLFTLTEPEWTVEAAARSLNVSASTAYRYFNSLTKVGLLAPSSGARYVLGPAIIAYDRQLRLQDPVLQVARPIMDQLVRRNGGNGVALLCRRFKQEVICVHQAFEESPTHPVSYERGRPMGLYRGAASLIILANLPGRTLRSFWAQHASGMSAAGLGDSWEEVRSMLRAMKAVGHAITRGQVDKGMVGIAAPIWDADGQVAGSVSLVVQESSVSASDIARASVLVEAAGREIDTGIKERAIGAGESKTDRPGGSISRTRSPE